MADRKLTVFILPIPVPVIITYLNCLIKDGKPEIYEDIYHSDNSLEKMFN